MDTARQEKTECRTGRREGDDELEPGNLLALSLLYIPTTDGRL